LRIEDLENYYSQLENNKIQWKSQVGEDLNWELSFDNVKEYERNKTRSSSPSLQRKRSIPQLVEYFLDDHLNGSKKRFFSSR